MNASELAHFAGIGAMVMLAAGIAAAADPQPAPFAHGNPAEGKVLAERDCVACHARQMQGDAERMYLRSDRRVHTAAQLVAQVSYCNTQLGTNYFPEDEEHVAAFLNQRYYRFPAGPGK